MPVTTLDTIWVCDDCWMAIATDDYTGFDYHYSPEEAERRIREVAAGIASFAPATLHAGDGSDEFSRRACECCGSTGAGTRHEAIVFGEDAE